MTAANPTLRVEQITISTAHHPERIARDIHSGLLDLADPAGTPLGHAIRDGHLTAADLTGATALVTLGLARVAHDIGARSVYVTGERGPGGQFLIGCQDRLLIGTATLFGTTHAPA